MAGNGKHTTYKHGDDWGSLWHCFTHIPADSATLLAKSDLFEFWDIKTQGTQD